MAAVDEYDMVRMHSEELMRAGAAARLASEARRPADRSVLRSVSRVLRSAARVWQGRPRPDAATGQRSAVAR